MYRAKSFHRLLIRNLVISSLLVSWFLATAQAQESGTPPADAPAEVSTDPSVTSPEPAPDAVTSAAAASSGGGAAGGGAGGGGSSIPGANDLLNFQTDLFTGRFSYSVPIAVAPARQGAEPKLALVYNSGAGNGWCGVGWNLEVGFIERQTKRGVPVKITGNNYTNEYNDAKGFLFNLGGIGGDLIDIGGGANTATRSTEPF